MILREFLNYAHDNQHVKHIG